MENYAGLSPLTSQGVVEAVAASNGEVDLFSLGNDGALYHLLRDNDSASGWSIRTCLKTGQPIHSFSADGLGDGRMIVVAMDSHGQPYYAHQTATSEMGRLQPMGIPESLKDIYFYQVRMYGDGNAVVFALVKNTFRLNHYEAASDTWLGWVTTDQSEATSSNFKFTQFNGTRSDEKTVVFFGAAVNGQVYSFTTSSWDMPNDRGSWDSIVTWADTPQGRHQIKIDLVVPAPTGPQGMAIAGYCTTGYGENNEFQQGLYLLRQVRGQWQNGWTPLAPLVRPATKLLASRNASELLDLFVLEDNHQVEVLHERTSNDSLTSTPIVIATDVVQLTGARRADGNSVGFMVTSEGEALQCIQEQDTTNWETTPLALASPSAVVQLRSYSTEIAILDAAGNPVTSGNVELWAHAVTPVQVNGKGVMLSPSAPYVTTLNAVGLVNVIFSTTSLASPVYRVRHEDMPEGELVELQVNVDVQDRLEQVTGDDLLSATLQDGTPLMRGDYDNSDVANAVAGAVRSSMSLCRPPLPDDAELSAVAAPNNLTRVTVNAATPFLLHRIDPSRVAEQHWRLSVASGLPAFEVLTRDQAADAMEVTRANWTGELWDSIGDIVAYIESTGAQVLEIIVSTVVDTALNLVTSIQSSITTLLNGVQGLFQGAVELVEQAFDIAEAAFATVGNAFSQLYDWLAFLFNWDDILRTARAISWTFGQTLEFVAQAIPYLSAPFEQAVSKLDQEISTRLAAFAASNLGQKTLSDLLSENPKGDPAVADSVAAGSSRNIFMNAFMDNIGAAVIGAPQKDLYTEADDATVVAASATSAEQEQSFFESDQFSDFTAFLQRFMNDPKLLLTTKLSEFATALDTLMRALLDGMVDVVRAALAALSDVVRTFLSIAQARWDIPVVTPLFEKITQDSGGQVTPMTALNLISLVIATPITALSKAVSDKAPFPDDATLQRFQNTFNATVFLQQSGLAEPHTAAAASSSNDPIYSSWAPFFFYVRGVASTLLVGLDLCSNVKMIAEQKAPKKQPPAPGTPLTETSPLLGGGSVTSYGTFDPSPVSPTPFDLLAVVIQSVQLFTWVMDCPFLTKPKGQQSFGVATGNQASNLLWLTVGGGIRGLEMYSVVSRSELAEWVQDQGPLLGTGFGLAKLSLVAVEEGLAGAPNALNTISRCCGCIPSLMRILGWEPVVKSTQGKSLILLTATDVIFDTLAATTSFIAGATVSTEAAVAV